MTDASVQKLTAPVGKRVEFFDAGTGGLCLRVSGGTERVDRKGKKFVKDGKRVWCLYYRQRGKLNRLTLGTYPALSLGLARDAANKAGLMREGGGDPKQAKADVKREANREPDTISKVVDDYIEAMKVGGTKRKKKPLAASYIANTRRNFDNHVIPDWGKRTIQTITQRDVADLLRKIKAKATKKGKGRQQGGPIAANRTLAAIQGLFTFARRNGLVTVSPADETVPVGEEKAKERVLTAEEIKAVWRGAEAISEPFGSFFMTCLVTGQRRTEVAKMRWDDLDLSPHRIETIGGDRPGETMSRDTGAVWLIPAGDNKSDRKHAVPLSPLAIRILQAIPRRMRERPDGTLEPSPWVFTTGGKASISGFSKAKLEID
ncbi:MAG TPA: integrase arm-type DNA-binding domain-containing protein, partial [Candidatus Saccharimonadales bacterium]|nr:integrase arm-type DNA-binding domain-containing protein [Candidatus Saccharimonadales bacterium]